MNTKQLSRLFNVVFLVGALSTCFWTYRLTECLVENYLIENSKKADPIRRVKRINELLRKASEQLKEEGKIEPTRTYEPPPKSNTGIDLGYSKFTYFLIDYKIALSVIGTIVGYILGFYVIKNGGLWIYRYIKGAD